MGKKKTNTSNENEIVRQAMTILSRRRSPDNLGRKVVPITCPVEGCNHSASAEGFRLHLREAHNLHFSKVIKEGRKFLPAKVIAANVAAAKKGMGKPISIMDPRYLKGE